MLITGDLLIGAQSVSGPERAFRAVNPATGEPLEPAFAFAGPSEVERACALAWEAFHIFRDTGLEERALFLETIAANILNIADALIERASAETGLPRGRLEGERARTVGQLKLFADVVRGGEWLEAAAAA
jgi:NADP-dependent aldehyde dehydrogenase